MEKKFITLQEWEEEYLNDEYEDEDFDKLYLEWNKQKVLYASIQERDRTLTPEDINYVRENSALAESVFKALFDLSKDDEDE